MAIQTINLGTAGTQSGDKVRDAFSKVNDNFANFQLDNLKGYYSVWDTTQYETASGAWSDTSVLLSNIPAGTYIIICSAYLTNLDQQLQTAVPQFMLVDNNNTSLDIVLTIDEDSGLGARMTGISKITRGSSFSIHGHYRCRNGYIEFGIRVENILLILLKVG